jgi:hypothetical protein
MKSPINLQRGHSDRIYRFWGNPKHLKAAVELICRLKGLKWIRNMQPDDF